MTSTPAAAPQDFGVRIVWDELHETEGSYAYETDEETREAEAEERAKLESGEWVVVGMIAYTRCPCCGTELETDPHTSLWGIVTDSSDLPNYGMWTLGGTVWDRSELRGYLADVWDQLRAEARS